MVFELVYFNLRGRAEAARILFEATGTEYKNTMLSFPEFGALKPATPFGQLPLLKDSEDDSFVLAQSNAILRFVASKVGLIPSCDKQAALADQYKEAIVDLLNDFMNHNPSPYRMDPETRKDYITKYMSEKMAKHLVPIERALQANGDKGILVGDSLSYVDYSMYLMLEYFTEVDAEALKDFPATRKLFDTVRTQPRVAAYLAREDRPKAWFN